MKQVKVQTGKKDLNKGLALSKEDYKRACANDYVIDCNARSPGNKEPKMKK